MIKKNTEKRPGTRVTQMSINEERNDIVDHDKTKGVDK
jgi:hypothetical protein